jgi:SAM-dependent MidA family methyltransferase
MPDPGPPRDAEEAARVRDVLDRLRALAGAPGTLPLDRFMDVALYSPGLGFYERRRSTLGPAGDFYTAAHVTPLFARTVAERVRAVRHAIGDPHPFSVVELGPGDGRLAEGLLEELREDGPGLEYVLVERSAPRAEETRVRAQSAGARIPVRSVPSVGSLGPFTGVVIANEFLDAQPARRLRWREGAWHEVGVRIGSAGAEWTELPNTPSVPGRGLPEPTEPVTLEFSPAAEGTVREVADHLERGSAIFLDYGLGEAELLRAHPEGTLAAVRAHRFLADPLDAPGSADLSTFVNFDRIRDAARTSGLNEVDFRRQAEVLGDWGFPRLLDAALAASDSAEARVRLTMAAKNLLFGFERFAVLELAPEASAQLVKG